MCFLHRHGLRKIHFFFSISPLIRLKTIESNTFLNNFLFVVQDILSSTKLFILILNGLTRQKWYFFFFFLLFFLETNKQTNNEPPLFPLQSPWPGNIWNQSNYWAQPREAWRNPSLAGCWSQIRNQGSYKNPACGQTLLHPSRTHPLLRSVPLKLESNLRGLNIAQMVETSPH